MVRHVRYVRRRAKNRRKIQPFFGSDPTSQALRRNPTTPTTHAENGWVGQTGKCVFLCPKASSFPWQEELKSILICQALEVLQVFANVEGVFAPNIYEITALQYVTNFISKEFLKIFSLPKCI